MSIRANDITITQVSGDLVCDVMLDATTPFGLLVQLRGAAVTAASATCTVKRGSTSVSLSTTIASGQVSTSITAANMTTLGVTRMDVLIAYWVITITDGSDSHVARVEQALGVGDAIWRFPLDYNELAAEVPQMSRACAVPTGQTNFWEQCRLGLDDLHHDINRKQADVKTYLLSRPGEFRQLARAYCLPYVLGTMITQTNGQGAQGWLGALRAEKLALKKTLWHDIAVTIKESGESFSSDTGGGRRVSLVQPVGTWGGGPVGGGGPW